MRTVLNDMIDSGLFDLNDMATLEEIFYERLGGEFRRSHILWEAMEKLRRQRARP